MKSKALAAVTAALLSAAIGVSFAAPSYAGTIPHSQDKTAISPAAAAGSTPAYAGPLCEGWGGDPVPGELDPCSVAPYATHNFQNEYKTSYWGMPADQDTAPDGVWANCRRRVHHGHFGAQPYHGDIPALGGQWPPVGRGQRVGQ